MSHQLNVICKRGLWTVKNCGTKYFIHFSYSLTSNFGDYFKSCLVQTFEKLYLTTELFHVVYHHWDL